jgi:O-antigen biosynthesis protein WbqV
VTFHRGYAAFVHDVIMAALSFVMALYLRLGEGLMPGWDFHQDTLAAGGFAVIAAITLSSGQMYKGVWRYASVRDLVSLVRAVSVSILIFYLIMFLATRLSDMPRTVPIIHWFVLVTLLGGPRFIYRIFKDHRRSLKVAAEGASRIPVLLVGAGDEADLFIRAMQAPDAHYHTVGMITDKNSRVGRHIHGIDVLGTFDDLEAVMKGLVQRGAAPQRLIITDHRLDGAVVRHLLDEADRLGLGLARIPRLSDLKDGISDSLEIKPIAVEDLLGRPQMILDRDAMASMIKDRTVLVTGSGGSIGSELVRQVAELKPALLVLFDACEFNLYSIDMEMSERWPDVKRLPVLGDVRDRVKVAETLRTYSPHVVFHAAALKHVPMVEANPEEGVLTNAVGTRIVAESCIAANVQVMVQISTDKAVNPTNVMGASKRLAEMYAQAQDLAANTRFVTVRFGNVLGSTGSVVPLFQRQLAAGGPLTVTHPDMTRYFMTVREAVELVLQALVWGVGHGSDRGKIMVLDMGEPVKILHLARQMIRLAGLRPEMDIGITFTGLRPGEKLFEEIFHGAEPPISTDSKGILLAAPRLVDLTELTKALDAIETAARTHDVQAVMTVLRDLVPEYQPCPAP